MHPPEAVGPGQKACFNLAIDVVAGANPNDPVGTLDVYDPNTTSILVEQKLKRGDFQGGLANMSEFCLAFDTSGRAGHSLQYRVYWQDWAKMAHDRVTVVWYHPTAQDPACSHAQYDALGRLVQVVNADGSTSTTEYVGRRTTVLDANGHRRDGLVDAFGRQVAAHEYPDGAGSPTTTRYAYDVLGNLTQVTDAAGNVITMTYNALGRKTEMSDPNMGQWTYEYDDAGNMTMQTDALGQTTVLVYDELQRLVRKQRADGVLLAEYTYDDFDPDLGQYGHGRRTGMTDLSGSTHSTFDQRGRLTKEIKSINGFGDFVTEFTYDAADRVVTMTYPDGEVVVNTYDSQGLLESVARADGTYAYVENADYDALGQMTLIEYGPANLNLSTEYEYDDENAQLESLVTTGPYEVLQNLAYAYDAVGNVLSITDTMNGGQVQHFSYDPLDRMEHAWTTGGGQGGFDRTYAYDAIGNIIDKDGLTYYYDPNHPHAVEAVVWGTTEPGSYAYDANGNMISRSENNTDYVQEYDFENRLASVTTNGETTSLVYDGDGKRVKTVESSGDTTAYLGGFYEVSTPPPPGKLATGRLTNVGSEEWRTVVLSQTYDSMVVIAAPNYEGGDAPAVVRVQHAAGNSFQIRVQNPSDEELNGYTVHYLVVEEGVYNLAQHGVKMEAKKYTSTVTDRVYSWIGQQRSYQQSYAHPVVLGQVMTANDPDWSVFWARGSVVGNPPTSSYLFTGKHVGHDFDTTRTNETIGYLVIESGSGSIGGFDYVAGLGLDSVRGMDDGPPFNYTIGGPAAAEIALVSAAAMDGGDGGWPVLYGSAPVSASLLRLAFDEDQIRDAERNHTDEEVPYLVFSGSRTLPSLGVEVKKYYYAMGRPVAMRVDDGGTENVFYLHGDHLGSTSLVVTGNNMWPSGVLVEAGRAWSRQLFTPYGETRWSNGVVPTDLQFTGQRHETDLGLYDFNARFYDPFLGRFVSPDPIVPEPETPQAFNRYAYALNNPQRYTDPTGHFSEEEIMAAFGVSTWGEVLAFFMEGSGHPLEGRWGWLEVLRQAHQYSRVLGAIDVWTVPGGDPYSWRGDAMIWIMEGQIVMGYAANYSYFIVDPNAINSRIVDPPGDPIFDVQAGHVEWATRYVAYRILEGIVDVAFETSAYEMHRHWRPRHDDTPIWMRPEDMISIGVSGTGIVLDFIPPLSPAWSYGVDAGTVAVAARNIASDPMQVSSSDALDIAGAIPVIGILPDVVGIIFTIFGYEWVYCP